MQEIHIPKLIDYGYDDALALGKNGGLYERAETAYVWDTLSKGDIFIDVGAHVGYYTVLAMEKVGKSGCVYAFEPDMLNYRTLEKNVKALKIGNAFVSNLGVSNFEGNRILYRKRNRSADSRLYKYADIKDIEKVRIVSLDSYLGDKIHPKIIKIDVQGMEFQVLLGAENIIKNHKPIILLEVWPEGFGLCGYTTEQIFSFLENHEYKIFRFHKESLIKTSAVEFLANVKRLENIICLQ